MKKLYLTMTAGAIFVANALQAIDYTATFINNCDVAVPVSITYLKKGHKTNENASSTIQPGGKFVATWHDDFKKMVVGKTSKKGENPFFKSTTTTTPIKDNAEISITTSTTTDSGVVTKNFVTRIGKVPSDQNVASVAAATPGAPVATAAVVNAATPNANLSPKNKINARRFAAATPGAPVADAVDAATPNVDVTPNNDPADTAQNRIAVRRAIANQ